MVNEDGRKGGRGYRPTVPCLSRQPVPELNMESLDSLCLTRVSRAGDQGSTGSRAGGTRSVGMTVNSSGKTLHSVLCATIRRSPQCPAPRSPCGPGESTEQPLASGNLASKILGAAADVLCSGNPSGGIRKALNRYRGIIRALSSPVDHR